MVQNMNGGPGGRGRKCAEGKSETCSSFCERTFLKSSIVLQSMLPVPLLRRAPCSYLVRKKCGGRGKNVQIKSERASVWQITTSTRLKSRLDFVFSMAGPQYSLRSSVAFSLARSLPAPSATAGNAFHILHYPFRLTLFKSTHAHYSHRSTVAGRAKDSRRTTEQRGHGERRDARAKRSQCN